MQGIGRVKKNLLGFNLRFSKEHLQCLWMKVATAEDFWENTDRIVKHLTKVFGLMFNWRLC